MFFLRTTKSTLQWMSSSAGGLGGNALTVNRTFLRISWEMPQKELTNVYDTTYLRVNVGVLSNIEGKRKARQSLVGKKPRRFLQNNEEVTFSRKGERLMQVFFRPSFAAYLCFYQEFGKQMNVCGRRSCSVLINLCCENKNSFCSEELHNWWELLTRWDPQHHFLQQTLAGIVETLRNI